MSAAPTPTQQARRIAVDWPRNPYSTTVPDDPARIVYDRAVDDCIAAYNEALAFLSAAPTLDQLNASGLAAALRQHADEHRRMALQLDQWARESVEGGWSTHQVDAMRRRADICRKYACAAENLLEKLHL